MYIAENRNLEFFGHPAIQSLIQIKWEKKVR
jgi:hypothetical protein